MRALLVLTFASDLLAGATLTGRVRDVLGSPVASVQAQVQLEGGGGTSFQTRTDDSGGFAFEALPEGEYTLRLVSPGFQLLQLRGIVTGGEKQIALPDLELSIGVTCDPNPIPEFFKFLPVGERFGHLAGRVRTSRDLALGDPLGNVEVVLVCGTTRPCGKTVTNAEGLFEFRSLSPGTYGIRANRQGFYPAWSSGYVVKAGREIGYYSIALDRCTSGNCDPAQRPKKPLAICE